MKTAMGAAMVMVRLGCGNDLDTHEGVADGMLVHFDKLAEEVAVLAEAMQMLGEPDKETEKEMMDATRRLGKAGQRAGPFMAQSTKCQEAWKRVGQKMLQLN